MDSIFSNMLYPRITCPTRLTAQTTTLNDNILSNYSICHTVNGFLFSDISDHLPIFSISFDNCNHQIQNEVITFHNINPRNIENFQERLANLDWSSIEESNDPSYAYTTFLKIYSRPFKPWISKGLMISIKQENKLSKKSLQTQNPAL